MRARGYRFQPPQSRPAAAAQFGVAAVAGRHTVIAEPGREEVAKTAVPFACTGAVPRVFPP